MKNMQGFSRMAMVFAVGMLFTCAEVHAQAIPVQLDTCLVSIPQRFRTIPIPGQFIPGNYKGLLTCPDLGNSVVKIDAAKAGKANHLRIDLEIADESLVRVRATTFGKKNFSRLYRQMLVQAGRPSRLVESGGKLSYSWEMQKKAEGKITMTYIPTQKLSWVVITP
jgi:hypothetical protein